MKPVSWLSPDQAREHLGFRTLAGFESFVRREQARPKSPLHVYWLRGRKRFRQVELDACVEQESKAGLTLVKGAGV